MLQVLQEANRVKITFNTYAIFIHTPWKPILNLIKYEHGEKKYIPVRHITATQNNAHTITLTCTELLEVRIEEAHDILLITYPLLPKHTEAVYITSVINKNFYVLDIWKHKNLVFKRKTSQEISGPYMYSTLFVAGVKASTITIKTTAKHLTIKTPPEGLAIAFSENMYKSAVQIHKVINKNLVPEFPPAGIYFMGGGGDIALSCKVQTLLDAHIPSQGVIFADLFPNASLSPSAWVSNYPDIKGEIQCYAQAGMVPCALLPLELEYGSKQATIHYSLELFKALKNAGIAFLGLQSQSSMPLYSLKKLAEYAIKSAKHQNLSISFSSADNLPVQYTYQMYYLNPVQTSIQRITSLCKASYGAFSIIAPVVMLSTDIWKDCSTLLMALEIAVFAPVLVLDTGTTSERTIPFMTRQQGKILQTMLALHAQLAPYHKFCLQNFITHQAPIHYLPTFIKKKNFSNAFMYGPDLLIGLRKNSNQKRLRLTLPKGTWIHFWTGLQYDSGSVVINVPLGYPAIFYKPESEFANLFDSIRRAGKKL